MRPEQLKALQHLIAAYRAEHDWRHDADPESTLDMLRECDEILGCLVMEYGMNAPEPQPLLTVEEYAACDDEIPF